MQGSKDTQLIMETLASIGLFDGLITLCTGLQYSKAKNA